MQDKAKKSYLSWVVALVVIVLVLSAYTLHNANALSYLSDDSAACNNCHVMNDVYASWRKSPHALITDGKPRASCNSCHLPNEFVSKWTAKAKSGMQHAYAFTFKLDDLPQYFTANDFSKSTVQANCIRCHSAVASVAINPTTRPDDAHSNQALNCASCHASVGHARDF